MCWCSGPCRVSDTDPYMLSHLLLVFSRPCLIGMNWHLLCPTNTLSFSLFGSLDFLTWWLPLSLILNMHAQVWLYTHAHMCLPLTDWVDGSLHPLFLMYACVLCTCLHLSICIIDKVIVSGVQLWVCLGEIWEDLPHPFLPHKHPSQGRGGLSSFIGQTNCLVVSSVSVVSRSDFSWDLYLSCALYSVDVILLMLWFSGN